MGGVITSLLDHASGLAVALASQGKRIANVRMTAWQSDQDRPVATAHAQFLLS